MIRKIISVSILAVSMIVSAQTDSTLVNLEDVLVTANSKFEIKRKDSGKPVIKITREDIEKQSAASIADLLNQYAGIEINGARSNAGQNLGYFIRGGNNRQVSFLIDGAQVNDASNIASDFDLRLISLDQVEEIEILKGASSSLYGANASTAVINIKLKEAARKKLQVTLSSFLGTNTSSELGINGVDEFTTNIYASGRASNGLTYAAGFSHQSTDGLSAAEAAEDAPANESDAFNRINLLGRIGYDNDRNFKLTSYISLDEYKAEFDNFDLTDGDNETYNKQIRWGTNVNWNYSDKGEIVYTDVSTHTKRDTRSGFPSIFNADGYSLDLYHKYTLGFKEGHELKTIGGFNFRTDQFESFSIPSGSSSFEQEISTDQANAQIYDPYVNAVYLSDFGLNLNAGLRYNNHSEYDAQFVYSINPSYSVEVGESILKGYATYSTAYITPSLFQLFDSTFGNADLQPEENRTIETGVEFLYKSSSLGVTFFNRKEENLVIFTNIDPVNFVFQYQNVENELTARGVEVTAQTSLFNDILQVNGNYSFTERDNAPLLVRIPKHKINASARVNVLPRTFLTARYQYNDGRGDAFFNSQTFASEAVVLDSYQLVDLDATYKLEKKQVTFFAGVSNLLNADYQELFGYQTRGRNYKVGVRLAF
ncbi:TonB-dependent receptor plug domain-containing protein [Nonlabens marinus]|uniref:TonB-dependent receptor n=1 Tax=Nonlabens marinus S1-08 TaxID=1454201 RepID=W8VWR8_9FLAO|nr:TonB-dependent receptor [Nonlabens marinus]BAO56568.1 TonB-dependent receptor [Nonlabens marinus S1-08]